LIFSRRIAGRYLKKGVSGEGVQTVLYAQVAAHLQAATGLTHFFPEDIADAKRSGRLPVMNSASRRFSI